MQRPNPFRARRSGTVGHVLASAALLLALAVGCVPSAPSASLKISTWPNTMFPAFAPTVTDYVTRCVPGVQTNAVIGAPAGATVSVNGRAPKEGGFSVPVNLSAGKSFPIVVNEAGKPPATYYVRCLPQDFPLWSARRTGPMQAEYFITVPAPVLGGNTYPIVFDGNGVPMWWDKAGDAAFATLLANGNMAWTLKGPFAGAPGPGVEERRLDGSLVRTIVPSVGATDMHEVLLLPNGNYVVAATTTRTGVDLSMLCADSECGPANTSVQDHVIEEIEPDGTVVWSWSTADHIPVTEMDPQWFSQFITSASAPYDVFHINSIEPTGTGFIMSFRHLDAIYNVDKATGDIVWKLGGSSRPESLTIVNDPVLQSSGFGGQHDARLLSDGSLTLHDNGTGRSRAPRAVRYQLDTGAVPGTATLVEQVGDPAMTTSLCCGSARRLPGGNWVMGWGGLNTATTEATPDGSRVFSLTFTAPTVTYRSIPVMPGELDRDALRAGMDSQYG